MLRRSGGSADLSQHVSVSEEFLKELEFAYEIPPTQLCCLAGSSSDLSQISQDWSHLLSTQVAPESQISQDWSHLLSTQVAAESQIDTQQYPTWDFPKESQINTQLYDLGVDCAQIDHEPTQLYDFGDIPTQIYETMQVRRPRWKEGVLKIMAVTKVTKVTSKPKKRRFKKQGVLRSTDPE